MKYMGSKRAMLRNGLGAILADNLVGMSRFVDLFAGSGAVACHVAENYAQSVLATDLQEYAAVLTRSIIARDQPLEFENWAPNWIAQAVYRAERAPEGTAYAALQSRLNLDSLSAQTLRARKASATADADFVRAYGGWYFSPWQALLLDSLRQEIDPDAPWKDVAIAAVIQAASRCAAAPGHTAQPFKPDTGAAPFLLESWLKDIVAHVTVGAHAICAKHARVKGDAYTADANEVASTLCERDLVFVDPPYSSVHYSRFYHVLESLARGWVGEVSGSGRYPSPDNRPVSLYSIPTKAEDTVRGLLETIAYAGATAIVTFPAGEASNRLSGHRIKQLASAHFDIVEDRYSSKFSTLGGDKKHRGARQETEEMILTLRAR